MAKMIPSTMVETGSEGEVRVFESLRSLLPDEYIVMHSLRWIGSSTKRSQGEADFAIFHPQKGLMAIEVKAGIMEYNNRQWKQTNRNTGIGKYITDPEHQASESKFKFINLLKNKRLMICHAVWFPSVDVFGIILPPNYNEEMLFDQKALQEPKKYLDKAFSFWEKETGYITNLSKEEESSIINSLAPNFRLAPSMKLEYQTNENSFVQLTDEQTRIIDFLKFQDKATIFGAAGTGKTFIAIEKARQLHEEGKNVIFLCYNNLLSEYLNLLYSHYGFTISTFDSLALKQVGNRGSYKDTRESFLNYLYSNENDFIYTDIVIDEGQDFESDWLEYLDLSINGVFYVFYDHNQSLYGKELPKFIANSPTRLTLTINCRNTESIAKTAYKVINEYNKSVKVLSGIEGKQPELLPLLSTFTDQSKQINKVINKFCSLTSVPLHKIAVITMENWDESSLSKISEIFKMKWSRNIENNHVLFNTARKFKGLEADLIIITDFDWYKMEDETYRNLLYTAFSRAKHQLYIISADIDTIDTSRVLKYLLGANSKRTGRRNLLKLLNLKN